MILNRRPGSELLGGPRGWGRGRNSTFSEYGHVAYQINWNHECSNMVAKILLVDPLSPTNSPPPRPWRVGSIGQNPSFSEYCHVTYLNKGNGMCSSMVDNISTHMHPFSTPRVGQKVKIQLYQNMVTLHIKLKGIMHAVKC